MESNVITDIQHAIHTIQEATSGGNKHLEGYRISERSLTSRLDPIQRELRSIIQCLNLLDHSYASQILDPSSRNLTIHRHVAFRAKDSVIAVNCAIGHLRHYIFWKSPEMTSSADLILKGTSISTQAFLRLLMERAVTIPDGFLAGLPSLPEFYRMMQQLGVLLTDLSRVHTIVRVNVADRTTVAPEGISARPDSATNQVDLHDVYLREDADSLNGSGCKHRNISTTFTPTTYVPVPPSNADDHDAEISRFSSDFATSISPVTTSRKQIANAISAHSLDLNYRFPPPANCQIWNQNTVEACMPDTKTPGTPKKRSRRKYHRRHHCNRNHIHVPHSLLASEVPSTVKVNDPTSTERHNAINSFPESIPKTSKLSNVHPVIIRMHHECLWNRPASLSLKQWPECSSV